MLRSSVVILLKDPLTAKELALELRVLPKTVYRWIADGKLKAVKTPGGGYRIWRRDVEMFEAISTERTKAKERASTGESSIL